MPGGNAFRPGDILRALNGKTIEITNTDAEGRLVLADALRYAREQGATHIVDVATLTGAMELALGDLYAGVFANDDEWRDALLEARRRRATTSGPSPAPALPPLRRLRLRRPEELVGAAQASPVLAAEFLREFAGDGPWAHIDMAGPGYLERSRGDYLTQRGRHRLGRPAARRARGAPRVNLRPERRARARPLRRSATSRSSASRRSQRSSIARRGSRTSSSPSSPSSA